MYIAIYPLPLVYGLFACENVDNCELTLYFFTTILLNHC